MRPLRRQRKIFLRPLKRQKMNKKPKIVESANKYSLVHVKISYIFKIISQLKKVISSKYYPKVLPTYLTKLLFLHCYWHVFFSIKKKVKEK